MSHSSQPLAISGPDDPHAFDGLPVLFRGAAACRTCQGRGCRNDILHPDSFRARLAICADCLGTGRHAEGGLLRIHDVVMIDGLPAWTVRDQRAPSRVLEMPIASSAGRAGLAKAA